MHLVHPVDREFSMQKEAGGYFSLQVSGFEMPCRYYFKPDDGGDYPDPASHYQPLGVHGPSEVVNHSAFVWDDFLWRGLPFKDLILYELHTGAFTPEGTFEAVIPLLDELFDTGINALELMPVAQFPGSRNWGYDGVYPYAVQNSYGGPDGLKKLVNACHLRGMAVFLDVVYNHLGPEGNYLKLFGPYFTDRYHLPWGDAMNFDGPWSDGVAEFICGNAVHWFENYHIDGLRLDAIHTIYDFGAVGIWELLREAVAEAQQRLGRSLYLVAESDLNAPRVVKSPDVGGYGFDAQWLDDFHHALYVLLDKAGRDRYVDFGNLSHLVKAYTDGFVHTGEFVSFRKKKFGASSAGIPGDRFVVFNQNHDQVGNRVGGERLPLLVDYRRLKLAAAAVFLSPYIPLLFMGEEYGEDANFFYFVSHSEPGLIKAVQEGRKREFEAYKWQVEPPDPQAEETFNKSKIDWKKRRQGSHKVLLEWHKSLIALRRNKSAFQNFNKSDLLVYVISDEAFMLHRRSDDAMQHAYCFFNLGEEAVAYTAPSLLMKSHKALDSEDPQWSPTDSDSGAPTLPSDMTAGHRLQVPPLSIAVYLSVGTSIKL